MEHLIQQLRVAVSGDKPSVENVLNLVRQIVQQLQKDKVPASEVREMALEIVEAVLVEVNPSGGEVSKLIRPMLPGVIDSGLSVMTRCVSWLFGLFSPKIVVTPLLSSVSAPPPVKKEGAVDVAEGAARVVETSQPLGSVPTYSIDLALEALAVRVVAEVPIVSSENEVASESVVPVVPSENVVPVVPSENVVPVVPVASSESVVPVVPSESVVPVVPSEDGVPVVPSENVVPVVPSENVVPVADASVDAEAHVDDDLDAEAPVDEPPLDEDEPPVDEPPVDEQPESEVEESSKEVPVLSIQELLATLD
jgi:hypothetical protein